MSPQQQRSRWHPARIARWVARARLGIYVGLVLVVLYFQWRYDFTRLPAGGVSPLREFRPGSRLVVDMHFGSVAPGDPVLYRSPGGTLLLGRVVEAPPSTAPSTAERIRAGSVWILKDVPEAAGEDSAKLGPIPRDRIVGRVVFALAF